MKWTKEEIDYLINNVENKDIKEIAIKINKTRSAVLNRINILRSHGNKIERYCKNKWTKKEILLLKENYHKKTINELLSMFPNRTISSIHTKAHKIKLTKNKEKKDLVFRNKRIYNYDENFFSNINNNSAYWAGFIRADGHLRREENNRIESLEIRISKKDINILENFKKQIKYTGNIVDRKDKKSNTNLSHISLCHGTKIINDLYDIWNIPWGDKTYFLLPPILKFDKNILLSHFIGFIDGDGTIFYSKSKRYYELGFSISGTYPMIDWCSVLIKDIIGYKPNIKKQFKCKNYKTSLKGIKSFILIEELKKIPLEFKLDRKWNIVKYNKKNPWRYSLND